VDVIEKPSEGSGERILVMDDDENIRFLLSEILTLYGYMTESACDGAQAIELYKKAHESTNQFDLVILDLTIPAGIGGKETIKELIKIDPDVKGIVSSGYSNDAIMANYRQYGFSGVISKPYRPDDLVRIVQDVLNSSK
jgi:CheY-like chemotaxis protein